MVWGVFFFFLFGGGVLGCICVCLFSCCFWWWWGVFVGESGGVFFGCLVMVGLDGVGW